MSADCDTPALDETEKTAGGRHSLMKNLRGYARSGFHELVNGAEHRVPFLDFLRTLAVLLVVNQHAGLAFAKQFRPNGYSNFWLTRNGWIGVDLFFVLSGFFIGSQLWRELNRTGTISFKNFMLRRGLRIWPLYFFIFLVVFAVTHGAPAKQHGWTDLVFLTNYMNHGIVQGSWSLCTEEQFYLLAPAMLLLFGKRSMQAYRWGIAGLLAVVFAVRSLTYIHFAGRFFVKSPTAFTHLYYPFHTHCDGLLVGLFVANLAADTRDHGRLYKHPAFLTLLALLLFFLMGRFQAETTGFLGLGLFFGALVWWGRGISEAFFKARAFYIFSRLSFGMYLNHEYMQSWVAYHVNSVVSGDHAAMKTALCFVVLSLLSALVSIATFLCIEHPFLMLRTMILRRKLASPLVAH